jgi:regulatory Fis family protein
VRELENLNERMIVLSSGDEITAADLRLKIRRDSPAEDTFLATLPEEGISLDAVERELIPRALERFKGNQTQAAKYLDISRQTLIYRMEKHGSWREGDADQPACSRNQKTAWCSNAMPFEDSQLEHLLGTCVSKSGNCLRYLQRGNSRPSVAGQVYVTCVPAGLGQVMAAAISLLLADGN